jgi:hypothetical protein
MNTNSLVGGRRELALARHGEGAGVDLMLATLAPEPFAGVRVLHGMRSRCIVFGPGVYWNVNLRQVHDAFFGPARDDDVLFIVQGGALFLSRSPDLPAMRTGIWVSCRSR